VLLLTYVGNAQPDIRGAGGRQRHLGTDGRIRADIINSIDTTPTMLGTSDVVGCIRADVINSIDTTPTMLGTSDVVLNDSLHLEVPPRQKANS